MKPIKGTFTYKSMTLGGLRDWIKIQDKAEFMNPEYNLAESLKVNGNPICRNCINWRKKGVLGIQYHKKSRKSEEFEGAGIAIGRCLLTNETKTAGELCDSFREKPEETGEKSSSKRPKGYRYQFHKHFQRRKK